MKKFFAVFMMLLSGILSANALGLSGGVNAKYLWWQADRNLSGVANEESNVNNDNFVLGAKYEQPVRDYSFQLYVRKSLFDVLPCVGCYVGLSTYATSLKWTAEAQINRVFSSGDVLSLRQRTNSHFGVLSESYNINPFCMWDLTAGIACNLGNLNITLAAGGRYYYLKSDMRVHNAQKAQNAQNISLALSYDQDAIRIKENFHVLSWVCDVVCGWALSSIPLSPVISLYGSFMLPREIKYETSEKFYVDTSVQQNYPVIEKTKKFGTLRVSGYEVGLAVEVGC
ncbi:MAG: hypothetical protein OXC30_04155 [Alphaproteobacteria bacterium]|nr:hypothetical protein [Alphaproteobacteria bacterium]